MNKKPEATQVQVELGAHLFKLRKETTRVKDRVAIIEGLIGAAFADRAIEHKGKYIIEQGKAQSLASQVGGCHYKYMMLHTSLSKTAQQFNELPTAKQMAGVDTLIPETKGGGGGR